MSVIIPAFNVEKYIRHCIDSVESQSYPLIEIIVVDDGSEDRTPLIIQELQNSHPEIKTHGQSNLGLSEARNQGMKLATGDYVFFMDSDDWIAPETIERLVELARQYDCDMVQGDFYYAYADRLMWDCRGRKKRRDYEILNTGEAIQQLIRNQKIKNFAWGKLWRRQCINGLQFPPGKKFEDSFWTHRAISRCKKVELLYAPLYYYRQRSDSISGKFSADHFDLVLGNLQRYEFIKSHFSECTQEMAYVLWKSLQAFIKNGKAHNANPQMAKAIEKCYQFKQSLRPDFDILLRNRIEYRIQEKTNLLDWAFEIYGRITDRLSARKIKVYLLI